MLFSRPVVIGLSPNLQSDDVILALKILLQFWKWKTGKSTGLVEQWFKDYYKVDTAVFFNAGRSALLAILKSLDLKPGSEIMCQAFTCVAVPNSIIWAGLKPVFVDIDNSLNIDIKDAGKKLTSKTKVLVAQHTFGIPANLEKITEFCHKHNLILIEDCAHALGARYNHKLLGTFGKAAFFSFGRDKIISSVFGGMAITNDKELSEKISVYQKKLSYPSFFWIGQQLLHPVITSLSLATYNFFNLGKIILYLSQKIKLLSFPVYQSEKFTQKPDCFPKKFPNALATLAINQLSLLNQFNAKRQKTANYYFSKLNKNGMTFPLKNSQAVYLRFNLLTEKASEIRFKAKKAGIILGNWYENVIDPKGIDFNKINYQFGSCPQAEKISSLSLNLPTYPNLNQKDIDTIIKLINYEQTSS